MLPFIQNLSVSPIPLADHALLSLSLQFDPPQPTHPPPQSPSRTIFRFDEGDPDIFSSSLRLILPDSDDFSRLETVSDKYHCLSSAIWESALKSFPHSIRTPSTFRKTGTSPMNKWYDTDCKLLHQDLRQAFRQSLPSYSIIQKNYRRLLRHKKRQFISQQRRELSALLTHSPKQFWGKILPRRSPPPSDLDPVSMFSHTSRLYDIPGQSQIQVTSPPLSCHLFTDKDVREAIWAMNSSKAADEEGFQAEFFKQGIRPLVGYLADLFNHVVREGFPPIWSHHIIYPIHKSGDTSDPNNYRTIMVGHTFSKLYATILHRKLSGDFEERDLRARGQAGFRSDHQTIDHIFTLRAVIEEARHQSSKVYCCFVDFRKAFDSVPREDLLQRLKDTNTPNSWLIAVMRLYESVLGRLRTVGGLSEFIRSTIGVKQGCPLSPTLFGIYIDELEAFLRDHIQESDGCYLHQVLIYILLFADDIALLSSSPEGLQRQLDALALFCDIRKLSVNLSKTKVIVFNGSKKSQDLRFLFKGERVEITNSYTYLGVQFSGPRFSLRPALQPRINKGYGSLAILERQCFRHHFQDISSKLSLMDALIRPTVLYGSEVWGPSLLESDWAAVERVQTLLLRRIIRCKHTIPHQIILAEFGTPPFRLETAFRLVSFLHRARSFADTLKGRERYPYLAYCSSEAIDRTQPGKAKCWYTGVSKFLEAVGLHIDHLPPFRYSLNAPRGLPPRQELNKIIKEDIYRRFIQVTWVNPPGGLRPKMAFYAEHFLSIRDGLIVRPQYTLRHWMHALRIPLGQFRVGSHRLRVETDHQIERVDRTCRLCHTQEVETEWHFIFGCPIYYEIRGRYHCLFRGPQNLSSFFSYTDQRCVALYIQETLNHREHILQPPVRPSTTRQITSFFSVLPSTRGVKRSTSPCTDQSGSHRSTDSRLVKRRGPLLTRAQQQNRSRHLPERRPRISRSHRQHNGMQPAPTASNQQTLLNYPHLFSLGLGC